MQAIFKLSEVQSSNIFAINSHASDLTDMTALDNMNFILHSLWQTFDKCDSEMNLPQLSTLEIQIKVLLVGLLPYHLILILNTQQYIKGVYTEQLIITRILWIVRFISLFTKACKFSVSLDKSMHFRQSQEIFEDPTK